MTIYTINVYCCSILNVNAFEHKNSGFAICTRQTASQPNFSTSPLFLDLKLELKVHVLHKINPAKKISNKPCFNLGNFPFILSSHGRSTMEANASLLKWQV